jgi:uncharacterized protein YjcR
MSGGKQQSPESIKAFKLWEKSGRTMKPSAIAAKLGLSAALIRKWKSYYGWDEIPGKRRGAPKGNKNAVGNNGGAPSGNDNAVSHGLFRRLMPDELIELAEEFADKDPIDMLWDMVVISYTKIMHSLKILFVRDRQDQTKVLTKFAKGQFGDTKEWEYQHAWDKEASALKVHATASREFRGAIKQFLSIAPEEDERRLKLEVMQLQAEKLKLEVKKLANPNDGDTDDELINNWVEGVNDDD